MANRNRDYGNGYERVIVNELKCLGYDVVTARAESRNMDNKKVDVFSPLGCENNLPYYIQCKATINKPDYHNLIISMPQDRAPIVFHRQMKKAKKNNVKQGEYVIMRKEHFYELLKLMK